jgi:hypothetical protein
MLHRPTYHGKFVIHNCGNNLISFVCLKKKLGQTLWSESWTHWLIRLLCSIVQILWNRHWRRTTHHHSWDSLIVNQSLCQLFHSFHISKTLKVKLLMCREQMFFSYLGGGFLLKWPSSIRIFSKIW